MAADPKNVVYLISGRDGDFLEEHWGMVDKLGLSAEHGSFVKQPGDEEFSNMTETLDMSWMSEVEEIFRYYMEVSQFSHGHRFMLNVSRERLDQRLK